MKNEIYPRFFNRKGDLIAILKPDRMFHLKTAQYGKGDGFEFRIYITRAMVLKYGSGTPNINFEQFKQQLQSVFHKYLTEINELLPKGFLEQQENKKLLTTQKQKP